jgi:uncharacterized repeat protein (TIGR03806 family)
MSCLLALVLVGCHGKIEVGDSPTDTDRVDTDVIDTEVVDTDVTPVTYGLDERPSNMTCVAPARPVSDVSIALTHVFAGLSFDSPIAMRQLPGDASRWYLAQQTGEVLVFDNVDTVRSSTTFIDLSGTVVVGSETGLLGIAFHPDFATNGYVYLSYDDRSPGLTSKIVRFQSTDGGLTADPSTATLILSLHQPYSNHNGGNILFGPDGYLYIGFGDGGSGGDPQGNGQNTDVLLGKMLRIDVDGGSPYAVPADNPFVGVDGADEIYAYGLRNPWRWSFDRETGDLWVGDVGQDAWEEVDRVERGGNYGWNAKEGTHCYDARSPCDDPQWIDPLVDYSHNLGSAVCGGYVYRGAANPDLVGKYLYADTYSGRFWDLSDDPITGEPVATVLIDNSGLFVTSFAEDLDGELYVLDYGGGGIYRIDPAGPPVEDTFPTRLSETGCVSPTDPTEPASGLVPYDVNVALWSDGAAKDRWMAIPDGATIGVNADGSWDYPPGTVLMKRFSVGGRPVETRLLMRHDDGNWAGYSYAWNDAGTDADLLPGAAERTFGTDTWSYPSRGECLECHTGAAGRVLGVRTEQLNRNYVYELGTANELTTLDHIGMFTAAIGDPTALPAMPVVDGPAPVEDRAAAYLAANCSQCHRPGGTGGGDLDLTFGTAFADQGLCGVSPQAGDLGVAGAKLVDPGSAANSIVSLRMHALDVHRMPPLGTSVVDPTGTALIDQWIDGLAACP